MYDLFVLGELMAEDKHGYVLQERLQYAVGPNRKISAGTLYPLLTRFEENGWITQSEQNEGGRTRKSYRLTELGRERFHTLIVSPIENHTDAELTFQFRLAYLHFVPKEARVACLRQYIQYLRNNLRYVNSLSEMIASKKIDDKQLYQVMRMLDHRKHMILADIEWVEKEADRIETAKEGTE